ncbi:hypothetical protein BKA66DRAFT_565478 [Pyrenochaeta sp. MPI-SDFR-AT-0127]|nr:hypothetical protein BKA66DRAFT_565478 [Pyrenochaeta sp. MPI-SDFR-AT-0127]
MQNVESSCHAYIESLQTCPDKELAPQTRYQLASTFSNCSMNSYIDSFNCSYSGVPDSGMTLLYPTALSFKTGTGPTGPAVPVVGSQMCEYPEFMPIFNDSTRIFLEHRSSRITWALEKTPIQYLRCVTQRKLEEVNSCVSTTIRKLQWLPPGLFVYGGGKSCPRLSILIASTMLNILIEIAHVCLEIWWYKRRPTEKYFSWVELCRALILGFGVPLLMAFALSKSSVENSLIASLGIFLMTPRSAPIVALLSGIFLGKGFGSQVLLVDSLVSIASFFLMGTFTDMLKGPRVPPSIAAVDQPAELARVYLGLFLTTIPGFAIGALYFITGNAIIPLVLISIFLKMSVFAKLAFRIWAAWICFFAFFFAAPFLAMWEIGWMVVVKDKERVFPPLRFFRGLFGTGAHWLAMLGRYLFYWIWVGLMFAVFVGRWMFIVNVLQAAGDAFCPASLTPAVVGGTLVTLAVVAGNFALRVSGLTL